MVTSAKVSTSSDRLGAARRSTARTRATSSVVENGFGDVVVGAGIEAAHPVRSPRRGR